jgi:hypothetical protein
MIPLTLRDAQIIVAGSVFFLGGVCVLLGILVLITRGYSQEVKALASNTAKLGQKGVAEEATGLVSSASELVLAINQLVRTASGVGVFLVFFGSLMIVAAYWVVMQIQWPVA